MPTNKKIKKSEKKEKLSDTSPYIDPKNKDEIVAEIKAAETHDEVVKIISKTFPGWILGWPKRYSTDYPHFQNNWEYVCKKTNSKKLSIIIVDQITFNHPKFYILQMFAELLTCFGHSIRRKNEFVECKICRDALPTPEVYKQLKDRKIPSPDSWSNTCSTCKM